MNSPQVDNGFVRIATELLEAECRVKMSGSEWQVYRCIQRKTFGWCKTHDQISLTQFEKETDLDRRQVISAIKGLVAKNMIVVKKNGLGKINTYSIQKDYKLWEVVRKSSLVIKNGESSVKKCQKVVKESSHTKDIITKDNTKDTNEHFDDFWNAYPKKMNKGHAEKAWKKLKPDQALHEQILKAIYAARKTPGWCKDKGQFIPYPATWLNAKGWEDEHEPAKQTTSQTIPEGVYC